MSWQAGTTLSGGDDLTFVGKADNVVDLHAMRGLLPTDYTHVRAFVPGSIRSSRRSSGPTRSSSVAR